MRPIARALRLLRRERGLWKYALRPLGWAALAYLALVLAAAFFGERLGERVFGGSAVGGAVGTAAGLVVTILLVGLVYLPLVALISGFGFDALSREVEEREFGHSVGPPLGFAAGFGDGVLRALLAAVFGLLALGLSATVVGPWLVASLLILLDATAPALLRRGVSLRRQLSVARRLPGALPFALVCGAVVLIPVVNVLALPLLVAAGTLLVAEGASSIDH